MKTIRTLKGSPRGGMFPDCEGILFNANVCIMTLCKSKCLQLNFSLSKCTPVEWFKCTPVQYCSYVSIKACPEANRFTRMNAIRLSNGMIHINNCTHTDRNGKYDRKYQWDKLSLWSTAQTPDLKSGWRQGLLDFWPGFKEGVSFWRSVAIPIYLGLCFLRREKSWF